MEFFCFASLKSLKKGVGSGSVSQRYRSGDPDPDPYQNVTIPTLVLLLFCICLNAFTVTTPFKGWLSSYRENRDTSLMKSQAIFIALSYSWYIGIDVLELLFIFTFMIILFLLLFTYFGRRELVHVV